MARGYQSYRGRRAASTKVLVAVLVLILLAACIFMIIQSYASYTDDGQLHFDLPFLQGLFQKEDQEEPPPEDADEPAQSGEDINLVIGEGEDATVVEPIDSQPEEPSAPAEHRVVSLAALPASVSTLPADMGDLAAGAAADTLARTGATAFLYPIRDNTGRVFYASASAANKAAAVDEAGTEALRALCAGESLAIAQFNCFHDSYYAYTHMAEAAVCQRNGYVWYDFQSYHWLDPSKEQARSYVIGLAQECVQLGFDELLLEEMAYPTRGKLEKIDYSGNAIGKTEALVLFLTELRAALEPYGTKISLLVSEELLQAGADEESGEDLTALLPLVDAVYAQVADVDGARALVAQYAGEGPVPEFVPVVGEVRSGSWCLLPG